MPEDSLSFHQPAAVWTEALPLGNGVTGAMLFGGAPRERLQINDGRGWSGNPQSETIAPQLTRERAREILADSREAIARSDYVAATEVLKSFQHRHSQSFLPFADLWVGITSAASGAEVSEYSRALDLKHATHRTQYELGGSLLTQTCFLSHADGVLVYEVQAEHEHGVEIELCLESVLRIAHTSADRGGHAWLDLTLPADVYPNHDDAAHPVVYADDDTLSSAGAVALRWRHDGREQEPVVSDDSITLRARGVSRATIYLATETTFAGLGRTPTGSARSARTRAIERTDKAIAQGSDAVQARHRADHGELYDRVALSIGKPATAIGNAASAHLPVDQRLAVANECADGALAADPALAVLLFNYGRYLLISSSRAGGTPANLQGIWNDSLRAPWSSNYTVNINLQMNYWQAEVANLPETLPPLFELIQALSVTGAATAERLYGAAGWTAHHNTDIWGYSLPVGNGGHDPKWAFWPLAGAWLVRHLWEHVRFGADTDFVRDQAWKPIRGAAAFLLDWLVEMPDGALGTSPSTSPENQFETADGVASVATSSTCDITLIGDVFDMLAALAPTVGAAGDPVVTAAAAARARLPEIVIGPDGMIEEWPAQSRFPEPDHRHQSHLYFIFPGDRPVTPALAAAATRSLDARGDESTGWSLAWKLALRARLRQPDKVSDLLRLFFRAADSARGSMSGGLYHNMFAAHPPFQIDGNLGFVAALAECLVQSHAGVIELLPSVPSEFGSGSVAGLVARPGIDVSIAWSTDSSGKITLREATLLARSTRTAGTHLVRYQNTTMPVEVAVGRETRLTAQMFASTNDLATPEGITDDLDRDAG